LRDSGAADGPEAVTFADDRLEVLGTLRITP
jgi:hypothetical protein